MTDTAPRDLDTTGVLDALVDSRRTADRAEAHILALAVHYVDLHPVTDQAPAATWADRGFDGIRPANTHDVTETPLGGDGTPGIAEYAVEELAAALNVSYHTGLGLVCDAVELCYRLPRLWELVQHGHLQAWKARTVATETTALSRDAAGFVDAQLAATARRNKLPGPGGIRALVKHALTRWDPDAAAAAEHTEAGRRGVWFDNRESTATTQLTATLDTADAVGLDTTLTDLATTLGRLGDSANVDIRRAHALGILADPQHALNLLTNPDTDPDTAANQDAAPAGAVTAAAEARQATSAGQTGGAATGDSAHADDAGTSTGSGWRPTRPRAVLYVHMSAAEVATGTGGAWIEKLGPITLDLPATWLQPTGLGVGGGGTGDCGPTSARGLGGIAVRPVLDMNASRAVDVHDPPPVMRE